MSVRAVHQLKLIIACVMVQEEEELRRLEEEAERAREDAIRRKQDKKDRRYCDQSLPVELIIPCRIIANATSGVTCRSIVLIPSIPQFGHPVM